jgi:SNF2 family DNA or RNA helicase
VSIDLYPYQKSAIQKLYTQSARLVGDEMGTGKTVIGLGLDEVNGSIDGRTLVVTPKSVFSGWKRHHQLMQEGRPLVVIDPKNREPFEKAILDKGHEGLFICHYEALRLLPVVMEKKARFDHVIADEVHRAKNRGAQQTKALKKIGSDLKTGLTGTPADNGVQDIWSILNWLYPKEWRSYWKFFKRYVNYIVSEDGYNIIIGNKDETIPELRAKIAPYYIRRTKDEVMPDLPEKYYTPVEVELSPKERRAYKAMQHEMIAWVGENEQYPVVAAVAISQLARLTMYANGYSTALLDSSGEQVYRKVVNKQTHEVEWRPVFVMDEPSAKLDAVMELIEELHGEQVGIFTNYTQVLDLLQARLERAKVSWVRLDGNSRDDERASAIDQFRSGAAQCFLGTHGAGGIGIELQSASRLIRIDRAWSPSVNKQVEDRFHRHGQKNAVQIIDIIAKGTVDVVKERKLVQKWEWIKAVIEQAGDQ